MPRMPEPPTEAELLERAKAGDARAFERLFVPYVPMLFAYGWTLCGDYHAAQDAVQETGLIAFRKLPTFSPEFDFATWLKSIARRKSLETRAKLGRVRLLNPEAIERVFEEPDLEIVRSQQGALSECLKRLDPKMSHLVNAHYFEGRKLAEVAERLRSSVTAVKQMLYRARLALQDCVRRRLRTENAG